MNQKRVLKLLDEQKKEILIAVDEKLLEQKREFGNGVGVLSEDFQGKLDFIIERFLDNYERLLKIEDMLSAHKESI